MTGRNLTWLRKQPVITFYLLAFSITWMGWLPQAAYSHGFFPFDSPIFYVLGGFGPLLAVFIVHRIVFGRVDFSAIFKPFLHWRVSPGWYPVALFGYAMMWMAALVWQGVLQPEIAKLGPPSAWLPIFLLPCWQQSPSKWPGVDMYCLDCNCAIAPWSLA